jgi:hypothetical protein
MRTLQHHARIATDLSSLNSRIAALANSFKEVEPRNAADEALIGLMLEQSTALAEAALALLTVQYDPTPAEPDAP